MPSGGIDPTLSEPKAAQVPVKAKLIASCSMAQACASIECYDKILGGRVAYNAEEVFSARPVDELDPPPVRTKPGHLMVNSGRTKPVRLYLSIVCVCLLMIIVMMIPGTHILEGDFPRLPLPVITVLG